MFRVRFTFLFLSFISFLIIACERPQQQDISPVTSSPVNIVATPELNHVTFYLENSGGMHGYVSELNDFIRVVSEIAQKPRFVTSNPEFDFNFINGTRQLVVTPIGNRPADFTSKLNTTDINVGDISGNDLNAMFQLALGKAGNDSISIFISDAIFDIQKQNTREETLQALIVEGRETRRQFIERLNSEENIQTLLIKLSSNFRGTYYYADSFGDQQINQKRPYYIFVFGSSELLNDYFDNDYITNRLPGYENHVRFFIPNGAGVQYRPTPHDMIGSFRFSPTNPTTLTRVRSNNNSVFQFSVAVDFSSIPVTKEYLMNIENYTVNNNYRLERIETISSGMILGALGDVNPTHLLTLRTTSSPSGNLEIQLLNQTPDWIVNSHIDDDSDILNNTDKTFGFEYLTNGIVEAYKYVADTDYLTNINIRLER